MAASLWVSGQDRVYAHMVVLECQLADEMTDVGDTRENI